MKVTHDFWLGGCFGRVLRLLYPLTPGPALMAVWSKVPLLTARCPSPLPGFESRPGHVRKFPVTWAKVAVFAGYSGFLHYLQLASTHTWLVTIDRIMTEKVTIKEIRNASYKGSWKCLVNT